MSFQYSAGGSGDFGVDLRVGAHHEVLPGQRSLPPSVPTCCPDGVPLNPTTVVFLTHLRGGRTYQLDPEVFVKGRTSPNYSISTSKMLIEIDATPSRPGAKLALEPRDVRRIVTRSPR
jgi:hypothetical protein